MGQVTLTWGPCDQSQGKKTVRRSLWPSFCYILKNLSTSKIQYAKVPYFGVACSEWCHWGYSKRGEPESGWKRPPPLSSQRPCHHLILTVLSWKLKFDHRNRSRQTGLNKTSLQGKVKLSLHLMAGQDLDSGASTFSVGTSEVEVEMRMIGSWDSEVRALLLKRACARWVGI